MDVHVPCCIRRLEIHPPRVAEIPLAIHGYTLYIQAFNRENKGREGGNKKLI